MRHDRPYSAGTEGDINMSGKESDDTLARTLAEAVDQDPAETREWLDAMDASVRESGAERGLYLLERLEERAQELGIVPHAQPFSASRNTIGLDQQPQRSTELGTVLRHSRSEESSNCRCRESLN